ncbi:MAG: POT-type proton-dependent oligopeptide transporter [Panacagrimonas sp.]
MTTATARMPSGIPYIVANEFAERFCFYGINAILSLYMVQHLQFGEAQATTWQSLFKSGAYFFPLLGAVVSDVFWGKFKTIITFSMVYVAGCTVLALGTGQTTLAVGLFLVAFGTGGIKPCVSTNVGDQFTSSNQHLIERAFSWFYLSINAGALISIYFCPVLLDQYGPRAAFGMPAIAMAIATLVFWLGRKQFAVVPPAGRQWLRDVMSPQGLSLIGSLAIIYVFVAVFWALWDQSNGTTWILQAQSDLLDKNIRVFGLFDFTLLPAQVQVVNGIFILMLVPVFSYGIYPLMGRFFAVTPLRKIGIGLFVCASSFLIIAWIENRIQNGISTSVWWQILAYAVLTASEVLVSITALEFSYKQAPLRMKSFIMALYLLAVSAGNLLTAVVADSMIKPIDGVTVSAGAETRVRVPAEHGFVRGQKIDFFGATGLSVALEDGKTRALAGTYLVGETGADGTAPLLDVTHRKPVSTRGRFDTDAAEVSTYKLVGPQFFMFFAWLMAGMGVIFIFVARLYREKTFVREDLAAAQSA